MRVAGIMSGTSLDGIDVAIVDIDGKKIVTVAHGTIPYSPEIRVRILGVSNRQCHTGEISRLHFELGEQYGRALLGLCQSKDVPLNSIGLIGCHGQTVYHDGEAHARNTLQLGEAAVLAERTGIPVVSNFRARDIAAGGKGAPLVPYLDRLVFSDVEIPRVALNVGGIANITILAPGEEILAFDTGPGNMIMDQLAERFTDGRQLFDRDGEIAAKGKVHPPLLSELLDDAYFTLPPPKTAGREQYGADFIDRLCTGGLEPPDLMATASMFTAETVAQAIRNFAPRTREVVAAGGGIHNRVLMNALASLLPEVAISTTARFGIDPDAKEAIAFALLAYQTWQRVPGNVPTATGAGREVILGDLTL